ncbi:hypothetical protein GGI24_000988, partial [Coemansia furcata]
MSRKYSFEVVLHTLVFPETTSAEVTVYFSDSPGDHEVFALNPGQSTVDSQEIAYRGAIEVISPKTLLRAECRVVGLDTVITMPGFDNSEEGGSNLVQGVMSIETTLVHDVTAPSATDDEGVDLFTAVDPPPAALDAVDAEHISTDGTGKAGSLAALKSLSQMGTAHSSCADLSLSDLKDVSDQAVTEPVEPTNSPPSEDSTDAPEQPGPDAEVESDSVSISNLVEASAEGNIDSGAEMLSEASSELECVELQELVGDVDNVPGPNDDNNSATEGKVEVPIAEVVEAADDEAATEDFISEVSSVNKTATEVEEATDDAPLVVDVEESAALGTERIEEEPVGEVVGSAYEEPAAIDDESVAKEDIVVSDESAFEAVVPVIHERPIEPADAVVVEIGAETTGAASDDPAVKDVKADDPAVNAVVESADDAAVEDSAVDAAVVEDSADDAAVVESAVDAAVEDSAVVAAAVESADDAAVEDSAVDAAVVEDSAVDAAVEDSAVVAAVVEDSAVDAAVVEDSA